MAIEVKLSNGKCWPSQKAALDHFQQMLGRYADEQAVDDAQDHDDLVTPDNVRAVVESAGRTMMMLPNSGTRPVRQAQTFLLGRQQDQTFSYSCEMSLLV